MDFNILFIKKKDKKRKAVKSFKTDCQGIA